MMSDSRDGCGQVCETYNGPEPSWDDLVRAALHELVAWERSIGLEIPPRNLGMPESGSPEWVAWLGTVALLLVFVVGAVLTVVIP